MKALFITAYKVDKDNDDGDDNEDEIKRWLVGFLTHISRPVGK